MADKVVEKEKRYRAVVGLTFADGTRVEVGKVVPVKLLDTALWLIEQGKVK